MSKAPWPLLIFLLSVLALSGVYALLENAARWIKRDIARRQQR